MTADHPCVADQLSFCHIDDVSSVVIIVSDVNMFWSWYTKDLTCCSIRCCIYKNTVSFLYTKPKPTMPNMYEISKELDQLLIDIEMIEPTPEDPDWSIQAKEIMQEFERLNDSLDVKFNNIGKYKSQLESDIAWINQEIERLKNMKEKKARRIDDLINTASFIMNMQWIKEQETDMFAFKFKKNPPKIVITDEDRLLAKLPEDKKQKTIDRSSVELDEDMYQSLQQLWFDVTDKLNKKLLKEWINEVVSKDIAELIPTIEWFEKMTKKKQKETEKELREWILAKYTDLFQEVQEERLDVQ